MNTKHKTGFTLIEVLFAVMLIGLVVAAIAISSGASTMVNGVGIDLSTAEFLIEEIREMSAAMTFDQIDNYTLVNINPPIDVTGAAMPDFSAYTQKVNIVHVQEDAMQTVDATGTSGLLRITVTITKNNSPVSTTSWLRARTEG